MFAAYRPVLAIADVRRAIVLGFLIRIPMFTIGVLVTVHIVTTLDRSYAAAGLATTVLTGAIGLGAPWRGRLLDRYGLRRVVGPAIFVQTISAAVGPFVDYVPLLVVLVISGVFVIPGHAIIRQSLVTAVPPSQRRTALSLDGMLLELSAAIGPAAAIAVAMSWSTRWVLLIALILNVLAWSLLWWQNPVIHGEQRPEEPVARREWLGPRFIAILAACATATVVLSATDLGIVAILREQGRSELIGVAFALWCLGSLVGGLGYGARQTRTSLPVLLGLLAVTTALPAFANDLRTLLTALTVAGLLCQPTITAGVEAVTRLVPDRARGEAFGWHATSMTGGSALGAPLAGVAIDSGGAAAAFLVASAIGVVVAAVGAAVTGRRSPLPAG
jgi:MFS family permease